MPSVGNPTSRDEEQANGTNRRRVLQLGAVAMAGSGSAGCIAAEFPSMAGDGLGGGSAPQNPRNAKEDLQWWAAQPADGEEGRPFPVTGSWNTGGSYNQPWEEDASESWDPKYLTEEIENGRHVLPTFVDPINDAITVVGKRAADKKIDVEQIVKDSYYPDALDYCAEHGLPIAFRGWNMSDYPTRYERRYARIAGTTFTADNSSAQLKNGKLQRKITSPFSDPKYWRRVGEMWFDNPLVEELAERHPEPPRIVILNNNESPVRRWQLSAKHDRFVEEFGEETVKSMSRERKAEVLEEAYLERHEAMFDAAKEGAPSGWSDKMQFVSYNSFPSPKPNHIGSDSVRRIKDVEQLTEVHGEWAKGDGSMPEVYLNDWQVGRGKRDYNLWSPQEESTTFPIMAEQIFEERPEYYFANIGWEGGLPGRTRSAPNTLIVSSPEGDRTRRWDLDRYEGMLQFALWANRSRSFREFRGGATRDAYYQATWERYMDMVDRVWETEALHEFWKHGDLVSNPEVVEAINAAYEEDPNRNATFERFYLLTCDANPAPAEVGRFRGNLNLSVYALALQLGEAPERRWLVVAQTPMNGGKSGVTVTIPDHGDVTLDAVSRSGSFYVVNEAEDSVERVMTGHPAAIDVTPASAYVAAGTEVSVEAAVTVPPAGEFSQFEWELGEATTKTTGSLGTETVTLSSKGQHTIRVRGTTGDESVVGETTVWVGPEPADSVLVDVPLDRASSWSGPWETVGEEWPGELLEYRMVPNRGRVGEPALIGGEFVEDDDRGRVLEVQGNEGLWVPGNSDAAGAGSANRTLSFAFKPEAVEGRQVLCCQGHANAGWNLYLDGNTVYGGGWGVKDKFGNWKNWISGGTVEAGEWHRVALVMKGASSEELTDGALSLYLDGERVANGAARTLPGTYWAPRLGSVMTNTRFHDSSEFNGSKAFSGRFADFEMHLSAEPP